MSRGHAWVEKGVACNFKFLLFMIRVVREVKVVERNWSSMLWVL